MEIVVKTKNCDVPGRVREEAAQRLAHATRFFDRVLDVEAVFAQEAKRSAGATAVVEVIAHTKGHRLAAHGVGADHRSAFDMALERLERQLARYKTRLTDRRRRPAPEPAAPANPTAPMAPVA